jgi:pantothenate kinase-related protein Tda10
MAIIDDKSEHCIPFLLKRLEGHHQKHGKNAMPFFLGLNGIQGAGKTTLVSFMLLPSIYKKKTFYMHFVHQYRM